MLHTTNADMAHSNMCCAGIPHEQLWNPRTMRMHFKKQSAVSRAPTGEKGVASFESTGRYCSIILR